MTEDAPTPAAPRRSAGLTSILGLGLLLIFYALSPGPVLKYFGPNPPNAVAMLYVPLICLYDKVPAVHDFYEWYLKLWRV